MTMAALQGFEAFQKTVEDSNFSDIDFVSAAFRGDIGAVEVFAEAVRGKMLFEKTVSSWYYYESETHLWKQDPAKAHACEMTSKLWDECLSFMEHNESSISAVQREALNKWGSRLMSNAGREGILRSARGARAIWVTEDLWDGDPYLVHTPNGVFDLKTTEFRDAEPTDYFTRQTRAHFDPTAECPVWDRTVNEIFSGDQNLIEYFQRALGYTALGLANGSAEQKMFLCYGPKGCNGKNTLIDTVASVLGNYAGTAASTSFNQVGRDIPEDIHNMRHCRMIVASEPDRKNMVDEELVKALTGNREVRTRQLYENSTTWVPRFCIWMLANHYPRVANSPSLFRRIVVFPFHNSFEGAKKKPGLMTHMQREESSGILNWLIEGAHNWMRESLESNIPDAVLSAHKEFLDSTDVLRAFMLDELESVDGIGDLASEVYLAYKRFCNDNTYMSLGRNRFYEEMNSRGCDIVVVSGVKTLKGLKQKNRGVIR